MSSTLLIIPVLAVILASYIVIKAGTFALMMTGLDEKKAQFQALSAFTTTGFTTKDAELVVTNERRRRIVMTLMILGKAGLVSVISTLILSFTQGGLSSVPIKLVILTLFLFLLVKFLPHPKVVTWIRKRVVKSLSKRWGLEKETVEEILHITPDYGIAKVTVRDNSPLIGIPISQADFTRKEILILSIEREGSSIILPKAEDIIKKGDRLICYGRIKSIREAGSLNGC